MKKILCLIQPVCFRESNLSHNPLVSDTIKGTVQNVSEALNAYTQLLGQTPQGSNTYKLLLPILEALEYEAGK